MIALAALAAGPAAAQERALPYWASIAAGQATMRTGPERTYPGIWLYQRRDLPVRVVQVYGAWRRIVDRDGATGWMLAILLSARRTAMIGTALQPIRDRPDKAARLLWRAEPGVIGRIARCDGRWCRIQIGEKTGYVAQAGLWGADPGETFD